MLSAVKGDVVIRAFDKTPSLIIDCGNCADPHRLFPYIREEQLHSVYVVNAEAIYRFRDALIESQKWIHKLRLKQLIVTPIYTLFSYDDETENYNVIEHCWELMKKMKIPVTIGVKENDEFASRFADIYI